MKNSNLSVEQIRFIDDLSSLLGAWSLPANAARLYCYLQLLNEPVTLDDIARDLGISRSHAHTAARVLEGHDNLRRIGVRGSKRAFYLASDDPGAPLRSQAQTLGRMAKLISARTDDIAEGAARARLMQLAAFHMALQQAMESVAVRSPRKKT
jgi:DNA-binding transcriptional regulator GbsR (MarR family)